MDPVTGLHDAIGAELLRARLLNCARPLLGSRYEIQTVLGRGASGLVVEAIDQRLDRVVALKIRPAQGDSAVLREARALASLDHPNVVRVHDVDIVRARFDAREGDVWVVSMARLHGRTMRAWLREAPRRTSDILGVLIDAARGLAAAHAERIVHRDVKPDNIYVLADGAAQILDFGFAVQVISSRAEDDAVHVPAGTDPYMAPETRFGRATRRSDQFSLGVTLVEALTGHALPAGSRRPRGVSRALWHIARKATSARPDDRFTSVGEFVRHLEQASRVPAPRKAPRILLLALGVAGSLAGMNLIPGVRVEPAMRGEFRSITSRGATDGGSLPEATPSAADRCIPPQSGVRRFRIRVEEGWKEGMARSGEYLLGLEVRDERIWRVTLEKTKPIAEMLGVQEFSTPHACKLRMSVKSSTHRYDFDLDLNGEHTRGTFRTDGLEPNSAAYRGIVEPASPR
jgi:hypothetical protein